MYRLEGDFGGLIHEGTLADCKMIVRAMAKYGIREDKTRIVNTPFHDFTLPEELKNKIYNHVHEWRVDGLGRLSDVVNDSMWDMSDHELAEEYIQGVHVNEGETDALGDIAQNLINSFQAEQILLAPEEG